MLAGSFDAKNTKMRMETLKISRQNIRTFLEKRYNHHEVDAVMHVIKFPPVNTYDEHWRHLDRFISGDLKQKVRLGFMMHDLNENGHICPNDVFGFANQLKPTDTLKSSDVFQMVKGLNKKKVDENLPDGYMLKKLN